MLAIYMIFWSVIVIIILGLTRIRNLSQLIIVAMISTLVLILSQVLFAEFSAAAGQVPQSLIISNPGHFLSSGVEGWLALLVMPFGWLGPIIGFHFAQRWQPEHYEFG